MNVMDDMPPSAPADPRVERAGGRSRETARRVLLVLPALWLVGLGPQVGCTTPGRVVGLAAPEASGLEAAPSPASASWRQDPMADRTGRGAHGASVGPEGRTERSRERPSVGPEGRTDRSRPAASMSSIAATPRSMGSAPEPGKVRREGKRADRAQSALQVGAGLFLLSILLVPLVCALGSRPVCAHPRAPPRHAGPGDQDAVARPRSIVTIA